MRPKRVHVPTRNTAGKTVAPQALRWQVISASTVGAAFALGFGVTLAAQGAAAQPTGSGGRSLAALGTGLVDPAVKPYLNPKMLKEVPVGPGDVSKPVRMVLTSRAMTTALDDSGIPELALDAYQRAATRLAASDPACHLPWQLLAAIGRVESDDGRFGGAMLLPDGDTTRPIYGIPLDGRDGVALVRDTDHGRLDGDPNFDRAVGPMQFIPSTWAVYGADGNGDGKKDPNNIFDAALAAADYLCAGGGNMNNPVQEAGAVRRYNDANEYVTVVLALAASYEHGEAPTVPTSGPARASGDGRASKPGTPSSRHSKAPAPTKTPTQSETPAGAQTPTTQPTATADPTPTVTTEPAPTPSGQPSQAPLPSTAPPSHTGQTANIGWAPAMRQVVVKLLTAPKQATTRSVRPTHPGSRPAAGPTVLTVCATPATPESCATDMTTRPAEVRPGTARL